MSTSPQKKKLPGESLVCSLLDNDFNQDIEPWYKWWESAKDLTLAERENKFNGLAEDRRVRLRRVATKFNSCLVKRKRADSPPKRVKNVTLGGKDKEGSGDKGSRPKRSRKANEDDDFVESDEESGGDDGDDNSDGDYDEGDDISDDKMDDDSCDGDKPSKQKQKKSEKRTKNDKSEKRNESDKKSESRAVEKEGGSVDKVEKFYAKLKVQVKEMQQRCKCREDDDGRASLVLQTYTDLLSASDNLTLDRVSFLKAELEKKDKSIENDSLMNQVAWGKLLHEVMKVWNKKANNADPSTERPAAALSTYLKDTFGFSRSYCDKRVRLFHLVDKYPAFKLCSNNVKSFLEHARQLEKHIVDRNEVFFWWKIDNEQRAMEERDVIPVSFVKETVDLSGALTAKVEVGIGTSQFFRLPREEKSMRTQFNNGSLLVDRETNPRLVHKAQAPNPDSFVEVAVENLSAALTAFGKSGATGSSSSAPAGGSSSASVVLSSSPLDPPYPLYQTWQKLMHWRCECSLFDLLVLFKYGQEQPGLREFVEQQYPNLLVAADVLDMTHVLSGEQVLDTLRRGTSGNEKILAQGMEEVLDQYRSIVVWENAAKQFIERPSRFDVANMVDTLFYPTTTPTRYPNDVEQPVPIEALESFWQRAVGQYDADCPTDPLKQRYFARVQQVVPIVIEVYKRCKQYYKW